MDEITVETSPRRAERAPGRGRLALAAASLRAAARLRMVEPEIRGLHHLVRAGDVCFDVGAAYGMYTFPLAQLVGPRRAAMQRRGRADRGRARARHVAATSRR